MAPSAPYLSSSTGDHYNGSTLLAWTAAAASSSVASRTRRLLQSHPNKSCSRKIIARTTPFLSRGSSTTTTTNRSSSSLVALNALFIDDSVHHAAGANDDIPTLSSTLMMASSSNNNNLAADWNNPLQKDISHWLMTSKPDIQSNTILNMENPTTFLSTTISSSSTILASSSSSSSVEQQPQKPDRSPTKDEIALLQSAFASFYGQDRNVPQAYASLSKCIGIWEDTHQGGDEIAGLYRVRGDVDMEQFQPNDAEADYAKAIQYLEGPDGDMADPEELPAARLGRARAVRSLGSAATTSQALQASKDYEIYFISISQEDQEEVSAITKDSSGSEKTVAISSAVVDGIQRNPYGAWEWGMVNRVAHNYDEAAEIHRLASSAFDEIGDKPRSVICALDRGLDLASGLDGSSSSDKEGKTKLANAKQILDDAIKSDVNVGGRDVQLLQRVVAKEGEARLALAGILWDDGSSKGAAESQYGTACARLDELNSDYNAREEERVKAGRKVEAKPKGASLGFSMEDIVGAEEASCSRFKNDKFIEEKLVWNEGLQTKVKKFLTLSR